VASTLGCHCGQPSKQWTLDSQWVWRQGIDTHCLVGLWVGCHLYLRVWRQGIDSTTAQYVQLSVFVRSMQWTVQINV
jgi:hypothetical protein